MKDKELRKARRVIENVLREHVKSARFDRVATRPGYDADGDDVLRITAIFNDEPETRLDIDETIAVVHRLRRGLQDAGIEASRCRRSAPGRNGKPIPMNPVDLLAAARILALADEQGAPRQANLRRAVGTAYYALFCCLARCVADSLVGKTKGRRSERAWRQAYRSLEHGEAKHKFKSGSALGAFRQNCRLFAVLFSAMQTRRHDADYDPAIKFRRAEVLLDIQRIERAIELFGKVPARDRRDFAVYAVMKHRKQL